MTGLRSDKALLAGSSTHRKLQNVLSTYEVLKKLHFVSFSKPHIAFAPESCNPFPYAPEVRNPKEPFLHYHSIKQKIASLF